MQCEAFRYAAHYIAFIRVTYAPYFHFKHCNERLKLIVALQSEGMFVTFFLFKDRSCCLCNMQMNQQLVQRM